MSEGHRFVFNQLGLQVELVNFFSEGHSLRAGSAFAARNGVLVRPGVSFPLDQLSVRAVASPRYCPFHWPGRPDVEGRSRLAARRVAPVGFCER